jgi:hypothetical protein
MLLAYLSHLSVALSVVFFVSYLLNVFYLMSVDMDPPLLGVTLILLTTSIPCTVNHSLYLFCGPNAAFI